MLKQGFVSPCPPQSDEITSHKTILDRILTAPIIESLAHRWEGSSLISWKTDPLFGVRHRYLFFLFCVLLFSSVGLQIILLPCTYYSSYNPEPPENIAPILVRALQQNDSEFGMEPLHKRPGELPRLLLLLQPLPSFFAHLKSLAKSTKSTPLVSDTCTFLNFIEVVVSAREQVCLVQHFNARLGLTDTLISM
ncbi:uncharacterized protein LOC108674643 [Hyalella azteca]|uniref:Uncharacterized protein LOC108674643 n=1 Tax=Hyalella azteca TaxID=294128 RepID=A0A8B7NWJ6_HYAAZ|nr:uncharacterized protein LOC108674643 [Hyalella azteca]XP_018018091.1 uncharacterized protein LOC108674643 [Hyalella azteca]